MEEADIFFLIDQSGSIHPTDFQDMKKFIIEFLHTFRIGPDHVRLGVVKYGDNPSLEFDLTKYSDVKSLEQAVENIHQVGGGTETGKALKFMLPLFKKAEASRGHKVREHLVVITDGKSTDEVKVPAETLRAQGMTVYAIGVKNASKDQLQEIAGDPKKTFFVNDFDALKPIKDDIITDICTPDGKNQTRTRNRTGTRTDWPRLGLDQTSTRAGTGTRTGPDKIRTKTGLTRKKSNQTRS